LYGGTDGAYGSTHCKNYFRRTIAHNSLLIYDPDEKFTASGDFGNDGGQRLPNNRWEPQNLTMFTDPQRGYQTGEVLAHGFGPSKQTPDYTYMKGDLTRAYSSKVNEVKRSFIFLNLKDEKIPGALIVFDKIISSNPSYKKYRLLHSISEPVIKGNETTLTQTKNGKTGKLVNTCLIPAAENLEVSPVGGPGKEFWVFGKNYPNESRDTTSECTYERAAWRIEISPKKSAMEDYFLNVMQIMDDDAVKLNVKKIDGESITGTRISDRMVFVSKNASRIDHSFTFSILEKGEFKVLLTDLVAGKWQIMKNNQIVIPEITVKEEDGTMYFEANGGKYTIVKL
jgi:heparin/heparan-sulfate lyase